MACHSVCGQARDTKIGVNVVYYHLPNTWMKKLWGLYIKISKNHKKIDFRLLFCNKSYFFMSNLNLECSQLWFGVHIVHVAQKLGKLEFSPMDFSKVKLGDFGAPLREKYAT